MSYPIKLTKRGRNSSLSDMRTLLRLGAMLSSTFRMPAADPTALLPSVPPPMPASLNPKQTYRFDSRKRVIKVRVKKDIVTNKFEPAEERLFAAAEDNLVKATCRLYPEFEVFLEWYADPSVHRRYGPRVRPALICLYWGWSEPDAENDGDLQLDWRAFRDRLKATPLPVSELLDQVEEGEWLDPALVINGNPMVEFAWWAGYIACFQPYVMEAINEYRELWRVGRIARWRRKMRRRAAAAARSAAAAEAAARAAAEAGATVAGDVTL